jgi:hypothetical protein
MTSIKVNPGVPRSSVCGVEEIGDAVLSIAGNI